MKIVMRILGLALLLVVIVFTVNNKEVVGVDLWPAMASTIDLPVWGIAWIGIVVGLVIGYIVSWMSGGRSRQRLRTMHRALENERRESAILRKSLSKFETAEPEARVALPPSKAA